MLLSALKIAIWTTLDYLSNLEFTLTYRLVVSSNGLLRCSTSMIDNAASPEKFFVTSEAAGVRDQNQGAWDGPQSPGSYPML